MLLDKIMGNGKAGEPVASMPPQVAKNDIDIDWYRRMVRQAAVAGVQTEVHRLTPALADYLLNACNPDNRYIRAGRVNDYARDLSNGLWRFNGEALKISREGLLNDGQHRCQAVSLTGTSIEILWVFGLPRETRSTLDQGAARTAGDFLQMDGQPYAHNAPSVASAVMQIKRRGVAYDAGRGGRPTKREQVRFVTQHPRIVESCSAVNMRAAKPIGGHRALATAHYLIGEVAEAETVKEFFDRLLTGEELKARNPILVCRNRLINLAQNREAFAKRVECVIRGWNNYRSDRRVSSIVLSGGSLPKIAA